MKNWVIGLFTGLALIAITAPVGATGGGGSSTTGLKGTVLNAICFSTCLRAEQQDQCKIADSILCRDQCQYVPAPPVYYNGELIEEVTELDEKGEFVRVVPPNETACEACLDDLGRDQSSGLACAVATTEPPDSLCSAILGTSGAVNVVSIIDLSRYIEFKLPLPFNGDSLWPCEDTDDQQTTTTYAAHPKCTNSIDTPPQFWGASLGCRETIRSTWTSQGCPASACCPATSGGCTVPDATAPTNNTIQGDGRY